MWSKLFLQTTVFQYTLAGTTENGRFTKNSISTWTIYITKVITRVQLGDWAESMDLKDAYHHFMIAPSHSLNYLWFSIMGQQYHFRALPFGPTSAPWVFKELVITVAAHLKTHSNRLAVYLDGWMVANQNRKKLMLQRDKTLTLFNRLGFMKNTSKSNIVPTKNKTYIGELCCLHNLVNTTIHKTDDQFPAQLCKNVYSETRFNGIMHSVDYICKTTHEFFCILDWA